MSRSHSWELFVALVFILFGLLLLAGNLGWLAVNWNVIGALILMLFGVWLIWRAFQPSPFGTVAERSSYGFGDYRPDLAGKEVKSASFSHGFGNCELDLTRAVIPEGKNSVRVSLGFGDLQLLLPRDLAVAVRASAGFGSVHMLGHRTSGIAPHLEYRSDDYTTATRKLDVEASAGFGDVQVVRAG